MAWPPERLRRAARVPGPGCRNGTPCLRTSRLGVHEWRPGECPTRTDERSARTASWSLPSASRTGMPAARNARIRMGSACASAVVLGRDVVTSFRSRRRPWRAQDAVIEAVASADRAVRHARAAPPRQEAPPLGSSGATTALDGDAVLRRRPPGVASRLDERQESTHVFGLTQARRREGLRAAPPAAGRSRCRPRPWSGVQLRGDTLDHRVCGRVSHPVMTASLVRKQLRRDLECRRAAGREHPPGPSLGSK